MKTTILFLFLILLSSCIKESSNSSNNAVLNEYNITGRLLESSNNPVPVANFPIEASQPSSPSLLFNNYTAPGFSQITSTDNTGFFKFAYKTGNIVFVNENYNNITLIGKDTLRYKNYPFMWKAIPPAKNVTLNTVYLFKEISLLVRKINFKTGLSAGDSLQITSKEQSKNTLYSKTLYGPVSVNSLIILDTLFNFRFTDYNLTMPGYNFTTTLKSKTLYYHDTIIPVSNLYESVREIIFTH